MKRGGKSRKAVVAGNIRKAVEKGLFNAKVQPGEPVFGPAGESALIRSYLMEKQTFGFRLKRAVVNAGQNIVSVLRNTRTEYYGIHNLDVLAERGAIITSNHFNPLENTAILRVVKRVRKNSRMAAVSQASNFAMPGTVGFILRYADVIPVCNSSKEYMAGEFAGQIKEITDSGGFVLIYPEQEMWLDYRKPRPLKPGAYRYAARLGLPVISCFIEIRDGKAMFGIWNTRYIVHVLPMIWPDGSLNEKEAARKMMETDYLQKRTAYEAAYGKILDYGFDESDIAGGTE